MHRWLEVLLVCKKARRASDLNQTEKLFEVLHDHRWLKTRLRLSEPVSVEIEACFTEPDEKI